MNYLVGPYFVVRFHVGFILMHALTNRLVPEIRRSINAIVASSGSGSGSGSDIVVVVVVYSSNIYVIT